ncbi:hypothetical protein [Jeotgalibacillus sp. S-D1]|uniref:hypothetical protein n=1 Tax=Jeotgalibacillus sp. S-D1 TaxID=2552189 RepID=UPI001404B94C|nr:hypothetical protein [Jeotgalibacillus sp. S-D1]
MNRIEREESHLQQDNDKSEITVKAHQLLSSGMKEDEVQELAEYRDDGWEYVDEP